MSLLFNQLNISRADIPCVLDNGVGEAARSTQTVTLYITVNITPSNLYNSSPRIVTLPTEVVGSPAEEATIQEHIELPTPEHYQPVETGDTMPQNLEEMTATSTMNPPFAHHGGDEAMIRILPVDPSSPTPEHHQPVETSNTIPQSREEMSPTSINNPPLVLLQADEAMTQIHPIGPPNAWERAIGRIKWVMDTLSPIAEVSVIPL